MYVRRKPTCVWDCVGELGLLPVGCVRLHGPQPVGAEEGAGLTDLGTAAWAKSEVKLTVKDTYTHTLTCTSISHTYTTRV